MVKPTAQVKLILRRVKNGRMNKSEAARVLQISRKTLYSLLKGRNIRKTRKELISKNILGIVVVSPNLGPAKISSLLKRKGINLSSKSVWQVLKKFHLETITLREDFSFNFAKPREAIDNSTPIHLRLLPDARKRMIESHEPAKFNVSRKTYCKWSKRYETAVRNSLNIIESLSDSCPRGSAHPRGASREEEQSVLSLVLMHPEYSSHNIAFELGTIGNHGVQRILERNNLSHLEMRKAYAAARAVTPVPAQAEGSIFGRIKSVFETFTPNLAPAPPPKFNSIAKTFGISSFFTFIIVYGSILWINIISGGGSFTSGIGLIFATVALAAGTFFFLYSLKYYLTTAILLSFSNRQKKGQVDLENPGMNADLNSVHIKKYPYISVHIPFYNEKNVVERSIKAASSFDYPAYEVILCDDSTDETSDKIRGYQKSLLFKGELLKETKGDGWTLTEVEVKPGVTLKHLHRTTRNGYKGGALRLALRVCDPRTEFISIFDADFVPYPDSLNYFIKYFKVANSMNEDYGKSNIAAVQGYQWHVLNKSENWITRGVRSEYAGSYVVERSGAEIYKGLKQISGSVYMIRKDVLSQVGWGTSITEDFELTLKLYNAGFKVVYTPYVQAPAECVSTLRRMVRQRMRWAEGHSFNIKKMFAKLMLSPKLSNAEKFETAYLAPYYLQAFFFLVGTFSWFLSEAVFRVRLPFWSELWGWSLILTNMVSLPLMNSVGMFLEESGSRDYIGIASFMALSYIVVPFQAYAAVKGFLEKEEGPWFRTPKTGRVTDTFKRSVFYRFISGILPGKSAEAAETVHDFGGSRYLALSSSNSRFDSFDIRRAKGRRWVGKLMFVTLLIFSNTLLYFSGYIQAFAPQPVHAEQNFGSIGSPTENSVSSPAAPTPKANNFQNGVLAVNTDREVYLSGETAMIQMAALDSKGDSICNANLSVEVNGAKQTGVIKTGACLGNNVTNTADYVLYYKTGTNGTYNIKVTNITTGLTSQNSFTVSSSRALDIIRKTATRINPFKSYSYPVHLYVTSTNDYQGEITDQVPAGFQVINQGNAKVDNGKITWQVNLKKGETQMLSYGYISPKVSPELYKLGGKGEWQIASDAHICTSAGNGNWNVGSTWSACGGNGPVSGDIVYIGANSVTVTTATPAATTVSFTGTGGILTVTGTLAISGALTASNSAATAWSNVATGSGTLTAAAITVGSGTAPTSGTVATTLTSYVNSVSITGSGNLTINSYKGSSTYYNNGVFNLNAGTLTVGGAIVTSGANGTNTMIFSMTPPPGTATLNLGSAAPWTIGGTGTTTTSLNGYTSTVNYTGASQAIRGTTYTTLNFSGSGTDTIGAALTANGAFTNGSGITIATGNFALNFGGNFTNSGTALSAGSSTVTISGTATQSIAGYTTTGLTTMTKTGGTATFTGAVSGGALTINGSGGTLNLGTSLSHTFSGDVTLTAGTLNGGSSTLNENNTSATAWGGTGTNFTANTSTVIFGGANQTLSATTTTFNILTFAGTGTKTLTSITAMNSTFTNSTGVTIATGNFGLFFGGDFINSGTALSAGSSAIAMTGSTATQNIAGFTTTGAVSMTKTGGTATFTGAVSGGALTINGSGGTLNLGTSLSHTFTGTWTMTAGTLDGGSSTVNFQGTTSYTAGTFTANAGTVNYNGTIAQTVMNVNYNNLSFGGAHTTTSITINGAVGIAGTLANSATFSSGNFVLTGSTVTFSGASQSVFSLNSVAYATLNFSGSGTYVMTSAIAATGNFTNGSGITINTGNYGLTFGGNFTNSGTALSAGSSPITINGASTQSIAGYTTTGLTTMSKSALVATLAGNVSGGGLTINGSGGTLNLGTSLTHTFTGDVTLTAGTLNGGSSTLNENNTSTTAWGGTGANFTAGTSTIIFGGANQTLSATATTFNSLTFSGSGTKTLSSITTIGSTFANNTGVTINTGNFGLVFGGNFTNSGTALNAGSSTITIQGTLTQSIAGYTTTGLTSMTKTGGTATYTGAVSGGALTISGIGGTLNLGAGLTHTFSGTWTRTNGTLDGGSSIVNFSLAGTVVSGSGGTFTADAGTVNYNNASNQTTPPYTYYNLTLSGGGTKTFATTPTVSNVLSIEGTASISVTTGVVTYGASATLQYNHSGSLTATSKEWITPFVASGGIIIENTGAITTPGAVQIGDATHSPTLNISGGTLTPGSNLITLYGNFANTGTLTSGSGGMTITGTATQSIAGFTTTGTVSMTKTGGTATFTGAVTGANLTLNGIGGTLDLGTGLTHNFSGDITRTNGTFTADTSTINLNGGGSSTQNIVGTFTFYTLTATGSSARTIVFPSSTTTTITNSLTLTGAAGQLLALSPSVAMTTWTITPPATISVSYVSVTYSNATSCINAPNSSGSNVNLWDFYNKSCNLPPSVTLNTPTDTSVVTTSTPTLNFTGTDPDSDAIEYEVQLWNYATITLDNKSSSNVNGSNTLSWSHTVNTASNTYLVVGVATRNGRTVSSVTYGSQSLVYQVSSQTGGDARSEIWTLASPNTGAHTVTVTISATDTFEAGAVSYTGVSSIGNTGHNGGGATTSSTVSVSSNSNNLVVDTIGLQSQNTLVANGGQTPEVNEIGSAGTGGMSDTPGASTTTMGWTFNSDYWEESAVELVAAKNVSLDKFSTTNTGFADVTHPADTHPFPSGDSINYTIQAGDALPPGTYYWWAQGIDPSGSNRYGGNPGTFSFTYTNTPPTVTLNTPTNGGTGLSTTPTFNFTGTDAQSDTIEYEVNINSGAAITFDSHSGSATGANATSLAWSHTVNTASNTYLVVAVATRLGEPVTGITYGAQSLTFRKYSQTGSDARSEIWTLASPNTGAHTITISTTNATSITGEAAAFTGVGSVGNTGAAGSSGILQTSSSVTTSSSTNNVVVDSLSLQSANTSITANGGQTQKDTEVSSASAGGLSYKSGSATTSMGWTFNNDAWEEATVELVAYSTVNFYRYSTTDAGFTAGHPFTSGTAVNFTLQAGDALSAGTYYWLVRAIDPSGSNTYGSWSSTWSFVVGPITSTSATATGYSFQRKTWFDGTYFWESYYTGSEIEFWYSSDKISWNQNTSATITGMSNDFSLKIGSGVMWIVYKDNYSIGARASSGYPGTGFSWGSETTIFTGTSATNNYSYPYIARDYSNYIWVIARYTGSSVYYIKTIRATAAANTLPTGAEATYVVSDPTNSNSNVFATVTPISSLNQNMYITFVVNTALKGCIWVDASTTWRNTAGSSCINGANTDSIATVTSGIADNISTTHSSATIGNIHLTYIDSSGHAVYQEYTSAAWQTAVTLDSNSGNTNVSISYDYVDGSNDILYAFWIRSNHIYYKGGSTPYASANWSVVTDWHSGTNLTNLTTNYSDTNNASRPAYGEWTSGSGSPYTVNWDIIVPENPWMMIGFIPLVSYYLRRKKKSVAVERRKW